MSVSSPLEQERLAVALPDAAAELPAHQRVHLLVLVHLPRHPDQQAGVVQPLEVLVKIGIAPFRYCLRRARGRRVSLRHDPSFVWGVP